MFFKKCVYVVDKPEFFGKYIDKSNDKFSRLKKLQFSRL